MEHGKGALGHELSTSTRIRAVETQAPGGATKKA